MTALLKKECQEEKYQLTYWISALYK